MAAEFYSLIFLDIYEGQTRGAGRCTWTSVSERFQRPDLSSISPVFPWRWLVKFCGVIGCRTPTIKSYS